MMIKRRIVRKKLIELSKKNVPKLDPRLTAYTPEEAFKLLHNQTIIKWHNFILNKYEPNGKKFLLFLPCAATKPYDTSELYQITLSNLSKINILKKLHIIAISEPMAIVPEEYWKKYPVHNYDCPGLFLGFVKDRGLEWSSEYFEKTIFHLSKIVREFLEKHENHYKKILAFVRGNHEIILKRAIQDNQNISDKIHFVLTEKRKKKIIESRGFNSYIFKGLKSDVAQRFLIYDIKKEVK
jgi:predicted RNA-binding protein